MLLIPCTVQPSTIHGKGLFAERRIEIDELIWVFQPEVDIRIAKSALIDMDKDVATKLLNRCYINPSNPEYLVLCNDDAQYMNFSSQPNTRMALPVLCGESALRASRVIQPGEEITVPLESDADADRKLASSYRTKEHNLAA
jgi:uncharacterized protein